MGCPAPLLLLGGLCAPRLPHLPTNIRKAQDGSLTADPRSTVTDGGGKNTTPRMTRFRFFFFFFFFFCFFVFFWSNDAGKATSNSTENSTSLHQHWRAELETLCASPTQANVTAGHARPQKKAGVTPSAPCPPRKSNKEAANALAAAHDKMEHHRNLHACSKRRCNTGGSDLTRAFASNWTNVRASLDHREPTSSPRTTKRALGTWLPCVYGLSSVPPHPCQQHLALARHLPELQRRGLCPR